ncbi:hypothetical protein DFH06DRAFT_1475531 [Mycena polygramma]|nr:hypothetical protein DFH06DRAFT_1475531 [Mycena polygramma]
MSPNATPTYAFDERLAPLAIRTPIVAPPATYGDLRSLYLPEIYCRATSTSTSSLNINFAADPVQWSFHDPQLEEDILAVFDRWVARVGSDTVCPAPVAIHWNRLRAFIERTPYVEENWVFQLSVHIITLVDALLTPHLSITDTAVSSVSPALSDNVRGGRTHFIGHGNPWTTRITGTPQAFKQDKALLNALSSFVLNVNHIPKYHAKDGAGIFARLDLHRTWFLADEESRDVQCRYGSIFSGRELVLVQWVKVDGVPVLRNSDLLRVAGRKANTSVVALLIGMLLPDDAPFNEVGLDTQPWRDLRKAMQTYTEPQSEDASGQPGGPEGPGQGGAGGGGGIGRAGGGSSNERRQGRGEKRKGDDDGRNGREKVVRTTSSQDTLPELSKRGAPICLKYEGSSETLGFSIDRQDVIGLISRTTSLAPPLPTEESPVLTITLSHALPSQEEGAVWRGIAAGERVIVKRYTLDRFDELASELTARASLATLGPQLATCHGLIASRDLTRIALVMEDAGPSLEDTGGWAKTTPDERIEIFNLVRQIHVLSVKHGDIAPRNVIRRASGSICIIDFSLSDLHHMCPGFWCDELEGLLGHLDIP